MFASPVPPPSSPPPAPTPPDLPHLSASKPRRQPALIISAIVVILILLGGVGYAVWKYGLLSGIQTGPSAAPVAVSPDIPPFNLAGSTNADGAQDQQLKTAADNPATFADLTHDLSAQEVYKRLQERLGLKTEDTENDGLSDLAEILIYGTNPFYHDSDFDGQTDGAEVAAGSNPIGADSALTDFDKAAIAKRKDYWKTDFALSAELQQRSERDFVRINQAGKIAVLLDIYYEKNKTYPTAANWTEAWNELLKAQVAQLFGGSTTVAFDDPLHEAPYIYEYASTGRSYTFSYTLEGSGVKRTQQAQAGIPGDVTETATQASSSPVGILPGLVSAAQAQTIFNIGGRYAGTGRTTDGVSVDIYGDPAWINRANSLSLAQLKNEFLIAAQHNGTHQFPSYCDAGACYCSNGVTLAYGTNNAQCFGVGTSGSAVAGQPFNISVSFVNTGTRFWNSGGTAEYNLGFQDPQDNTKWGLGRVALPKSPIMPQGPALFNFTATAPTTPGTYNFATKMVQEGREWFGQICSYPIIVSAAPVSPTPVPAQCSDSTDNDADGKIDSADPGCHSDGNSNNPTSYVPSDSDETNIATPTPTATVGPTPTAGGPTPTASSTPQCSDAKDNDSDTKVDRADPGCHSDGNPNNATSYVPSDNDENNSSGTPAPTATPTSTPTFSPGIYHEN